MELKMNKGIGKLEFVAEEITRLILYSYLHIYNSAWSLPAKCTEQPHLSTDYPINGRLRPFALFYSAGLSHYPNYLQAKLSPFGIIRDYYFPPFYYSILQFIKAQF